MSWTCILIHGKRRVRSYDAVKRKKRMVKIEKSPVKGDSTGPFRETFNGVGKNPFFVAPTHTHYSYCTGRANFWFYVKFPNHGLFGWKH